MNSEKFKKIKDAITRYESEESRLSLAKRIHDDVLYKGRSLSVVTNSSRAQVSREVVDEVLMILVNSAKNKFNEAGIELDNLCGGVDEDGRKECACRV